MLNDILSSFACRRLSCLLTARLLLQLRKVHEDSRSGVGMHTRQTTSIRTQSMIVSVVFAAGATILDEFGSHDLITRSASDLDATRVEKDSIEEADAGRGDDIELRSGQFKSDAESPTAASFNQASLRDEEALVDGLPQKALVTSS